MVSNVFTNTQGREEWLDDDKAKPRVQTEPEEDTLDRKLSALNRVAETNKANDRAKYQSDFATISTAAKYVVPSFEYQDIESFRAPGPSQPEQKPRVRLAPNEPPVASQRVALCDTAKVNAIIEESDKVIKNLNLPLAPS